MKMHFLYSLANILFLSGCMHQSIENIQMRAAHDYNMLIMRYAEILRASDTQDILEQARLLSSDNHLSVWSCIGQSLLGNEHLVWSNGTPLHRAVYFMRNDGELLGSHLYNFECRGFIHTVLYQKMVELRHALIDLMRIIEAHKTFIQEDQFVEQQRLQKRQLYEQEKQTDLLKQIAQKEHEKPCKPIKRQPLIIHKIEEYNVYL
ncbi:MAG: hypothetical protein WA432_05065 [Candidatus Babeliaceae bacterium]